MSSQWAGRVLSRPLATRTALTFRSSTADTQARPPNNFKNLQREQGGSWEEALFGRVPAGLPNPVRTLNAQGDVGLPRCSHPLCGCSWPPRGEVRSGSGGVEAHPPRCTTDSRGSGSVGPAASPAMESRGAPSPAAPWLLGPGRRPRRLFVYLPGVKGPALGARRGAGAESARGKRRSVALSAAGQRGGAGGGRGRGSAGLGSGLRVARLSPPGPRRGRGCPGRGAHREWPRAGKMLHLPPPRPGRTVRLPRR